MSENKENKPHYHGHRARLRERFAKSGAAGLADYELLELLIMPSLPRRDVKPVAKELLDKFKTISAVLEAPTAELTQISGIGETAASAIKLSQAIALKYRHGKIEQRHAFNNKLDVLDYLYAKIGGLKHEEFHVIFLDSKNQIIADECLAKGSVNSSAVYPREVVKAALEKSAVGIILAHNHPSGDPTPSSDDHILTAEIKTIAKPLGITVHDHIIIGDGKHFSFAESKKL